MTEYLHLKTIERVRTINVFLFLQPSNDATSVSEQMLQCCIAHIIAITITSGPN
jgi:hypothetical protein